MKKNLKSLIASSAGSFMKKAALTIGVSLFAIAGVDAQCTTNNLMISTGLDVGPSMTAQNHLDRFWKITTKHRVFNNFIPVTRIDPAEVVIPLPAWDILWTSSWICDSQTHADPGLNIAPWAFPDASMTFGRYFCLNQAANVTFNLEILVDNYVSAIMVDGVVVPGAPSQTTPINATLPSWIVPSFTIPLSSGRHLIEIVVVEDNVTWSNPIGLSLTGSISTPTAAIIDDLKEGCICKKTGKLEGEEEEMQVINNGDNKTPNDAASLMNSINTNYTEMQQEIRELKTQLAELRQTLATGSVDKYNAQVQNELYQNNPNPFGKETSIGYNIVNMLQGAFIAVYDLNGKEIFRQAVTEKGKGSITLSGDKLVPGMYLYSLIVDGKETATKRMVVTK